MRIIKFNKLAKVGDHGELGDNEVFSARLKDVLDSDDPASPLSQRLYHVALSGDCEGNLERMFGVHGLRDALIRLAACVERMTPVPEEMADSALFWAGGVKVSLPDGTVGVTGDEVEFEVSALVPVRFGESDKVKLVSLSELSPAPHLYADSCEAQKVGDTCYTRSGEKVRIDEIDKIRGTCVVYSLETDRSSDMLLDDLFSELPRLGEDGMPVSVGDTVFDVHCRDQWEVEDIEELDVDGKRELVATCKAIGRPDVSTRFLLDDLRRSQATYDTGEPIYSGDIVYQEGSDMAYRVISPYCFGKVLIQAGQTSMRVDPGDISKQPPAKTIDGFDLVPGVKVYLYRHPDVGRVKVLGIDKRYMNAEVLDAAGGRHEVHVQDLSRTLHTHDSNGIAVSEGDRGTCSLFQADHVLEVVDVRFDNIALTDADGQEGDVPIVVSPYLFTITDTSGRKGIDDD